MLLLSNWPVTSSEPPCMDALTLPLVIGRVSEPWPPPACSLGADPASQDPASRDHDWDLVAAPRVKMIGALALGRPWQAADSPWGREVGWGRPPAAPPPCYAVSVRVVIDTSWPVDEYGDRMQEGVVMMCMLIVKNLTGVT